MNCDQILSPAMDSTGKPLAINLPVSIQCHPELQTCQNEKKSGHAGNNKDRSGSSYMKQFFMPLKRNGKVGVGNQKQCLGNENHIKSEKRVKQIYFKLC